MFKSRHKETSTGTCNNRVHVLLIGLVRLFLLRGRGTGLGSVTAMLLFIVVLKKEKTVLFTWLVSRQLEKFHLCRKGPQVLILQCSLVRFPKASWQMLHLLPASVWPPLVFQLCLRSALLHGGFAYGTLYNLQAVTLRKE